MIKRLLTLLILIGFVNTVYCHDLDEDELLYVQTLMQVTTNTVQNSRSNRFSSFRMKMRAPQGQFNSDYSTTTPQNKPELSKVIKGYVILGFKHILPKGLDHILFVIGLFLSSILLRPLLYQITAFTIAHSVTLALSVYGVVTLSSHMVEPLIALSIAYIAIENIWQTNITRWRPLIVFGFGLLHGLGFAGVLLELGLPKQDYLTGLVAFNVGVELGQITIILFAWLLLHRFYHHNWYRNRVVIPFSGIIALIGLYWTIERII